MLKKNDTVELAIYDMTNLGFGVGKSEGLVVFVSGAVVGDVVLAKIIKTTSSYAVGRIEKIITPSKERVYTRCPIENCHSCAYKLLNYEKELEMKREDVVSAFRKAELPNVKILNTAPSPSTEHYRNKAQYPIAKNKDGEYVIGFFAPKSHRVTEARYCPLSKEEFPEIIETLASFFKKHKLSVYDENTGVGLLRHIYIRRGEISGEIMLVLVINGNTMPATDELSAILTQKHPEIKAFLLNINKENTNVILGKQYVNVFGDGLITDTLCGVELKLSAPSFYQVNHGAAEFLYSKAKELARPTKTDLILDLYCGVGSIGLSMANDCRELIGIEIVESAVEMANENAKNAGFNNAKFYTGDAENTENLLKNAEKQLGKKLNPNIIILDPPRAGCAAKLIDFTASLSPDRIVYISCNPQTLARDVKLYTERGYFPGKVLPVDLFPGTGHVESVVCLTRRLDVDMRR